MELHLHSTLGMPHRHLRLVMAKVLQLVESVVMETLEDSTIR